MPIDRFYDKCKGTRACGRMIDRDPYWAANPDPVPQAEGKRRPEGRQPIQHLASIHFINKAPDNYQLTDFLDI